jgi:hypothetical protein
MRSTRQWEMKPGGQCYTLNRGHPIADKLLLYMPFTEGAGQRWTNLVTGQGPSTISGNSYALNWEMGPPGVFYNSPENNNIDQRYYRLPNASALTSATYGALMKFQGGGAVGGQAARFLRTNGGAAMVASTLAAIDNHFRCDFVVNTAYARCTTGQFALGDIRTIFAKWTSGSFPTLWTATWPTGEMTEPTYSSRGNTGTPADLSNMSILNMDNAGARYGPCAAWWLGIWGRELTISEMQALHDNPWQMIADDDDWYFQTAGGLFFRPDANALGSRVGRRPLAT